MQASTPLSPNYASGATVHFFVGLTIPILISYLANKTFPQLLHADPTKKIFFHVGAGCAGITGSYFITTISQNKAAFLAELVFGSLVGPGKFPKETYQAAAMGLANRLLIILGAAGAGLGGALSHFIISFKKTKKTGNE